MEMHFSNFRTSGEGGRGRGQEKGGPIQLVAIIMEDCIFFQNLKRRNQKSFDVQISIK